MTMDRKAVAFHEAYHCTCGYFLGRRVVKVTIDPTRPYYEALPKIGDDHLTDRRKCLVELLAPSLFEISKEGSDKDLEDAKAALAYLHENGVAEDLEFYKRISKVIMCRRQVIRASLALACILFHCESMDGDEVEEFLISYIKRWI